MHALLSFIHYIINRSDDSKNVIRIFVLDFVNAVDHIDHKILLCKLSSMEVPPIIIKWISNFLTEREQRVRIGPYVSEWQRIYGGVPQGTVLGPILFLVMVNHQPRPQALSCTLLNHTFKCRGLRAGNTQGENRRVFPSTGCSRFTHYPRKNGWAWGRGWSMTA